MLGRYKWPESLESDFVYSKCIAYDNGKQTPKQVIKFIVFFLLIIGASSIGGSATSGFQADFSSAAGKKALQHFDSQESDPEVPFCFEASLKTVTTSFVHETFALCS